MSLMDRVRKQEAEKKAAVGATEPTPEVKAEMDKLLAEEAAATRAKAAGVVTPPDVPQPTDVAQPLPAGTPAPGPCPLGGEVRKLTLEEAAGRAFTCSCGETVKIKPVQLPDKSYQAKIPDHGGPKKAKAPKTEAAPAPASPPPAVIPTATSAAVVDKTGEVQTFEVGSVLVGVDCRADGVAARRLETYAAEKAAALAQSQGLADLRLAGNDSIFGFGRWKGHLAALVREEPPTPGFYEVASSSEFGMFVLDELVGAGLAQAWRH